LLPRYAFSQPIWSQPTLRPPLNARTAARRASLSSTLNPFGIPAVSSLEFQLCSLFPSPPLPPPPVSRHVPARSCPGTRCCRSCWRYWATGRRPPVLQARWRSRCGAILVDRCAGGPRTRSDLHREPFFTFER
jgi:hypothetical protein